MATRQYIGARYIPIIVGDWDNTKEYEPLMVVYYNGASYTSKTFIPAGIDISNTTYWALSADYNAQVAAYRAEVLGFKNGLDEFESFIMDGYVTPEMFGAKGDGITDDTAALQEAFTHKNVYCPNIYNVTDTIEVESCRVFGGEFNYSGSEKAILFDIKANTVIIKNMIIDCDNKIGKAFNIGYYDSGNVRDYVEVAGCNIKNLSHSTEVIAAIHIEDEALNVNIKNNNIYNVHNDSASIIETVGIGVYYLDGICNIEDNIIDTVLTASTQDADGIKVHNLDKTTEDDHCVINISNNKMHNCNGRFVKIQGNGAKITGNSFILENVTVINRPSIIDSQYTGIIVENNEVVEDNITITSTYLTFVNQTNVGSHPITKPANTIIKNNNVRFKEFQYAFYYLEADPVNHLINVDIAGNNIVMDTSTLFRIHAANISTSLNLNVHDNNCKCAAMFLLFDDLKEHVNSSIMDAVQNYVKIVVANNSNTDKEAPIFSDSSVLPVQIKLIDNINFQEWIYSWRWSFNKLGNTRCYLASDATNTDGELLDIPTGVDAKYAKSVFIEGITYLKSGSNHYIAVRLSNMVTSDGQVGDVITKTQWLSS